MVALAVVAFFILMFLSFWTVVSLFKTIRARSKYDDYENNSDYQNAYKALLNSLKGAVVSLYIMVIGIFSSEPNKLPAMLLFITLCITAVAFVVYWWKKRSARLKAGENYQDDENYKKISLQKRVIGAVFVASLIWIPITIPMATTIRTMPAKTQEEHAAYLAQKAAQAEQEKAEAEKAEQDRIAAEQKAAAEKAEQDKIAAEQKAAAEKAEQERIAAEQKAAAEKAEQERIAAEQKAATEKKTATQKTSEPKKNAEDEGGLFDWLGEKIDSAKEFAGGVVSNEVKVCDLPAREDGIYSVYFVPSTKTRHTFGIIFKDEGYEVEVILKNPAGKIIDSSIYYFKDLGDYWEYKREHDRETEWLRVKENLDESKAEPEVLWLFLGSLIWQKSHNFPNL